MKKMVKKQYGFKKTLQLPYRIDYDCKKRGEILGDRGIMIIRQQKKGAKPFSNSKKQWKKTWKVFERKYKGSVKGQQYKSLGIYINKKEAEKRAFNYMKKKQCRR